MFNVLISNFDQLLRKLNNNNIKKKTDENSFETITADSIFHNIKDQVVEKCAIPVDNGFASN